MMLIVGFKNTVLLSLLGAALLLLHGCASLVDQVPARPLSLSPAEEEKLGAAIEPRLVQMLGGPYYDQAMGTDLQRLCFKKFQTSDSCKISVADSSAAAIYPVSSGRFVLTRGLLAETNSLAELLSYLEKAVDLTGHVYEDSATHATNESIKELLSNRGVAYAPDSADIRLARFFKERACEGDCLTPGQAARPGLPENTQLPASVVRLVAMRSGYELLRKASDIESQGDQGQAIATYLQAATETPDEPAILRALGMAYLRAGQLQSARLHLQEAVKLQPNYYRSRMGLGYFYLQSGKLSRASEMLAESVELLPVTENLFLLAEAREKSGDNKGARMLYKVIVESVPDSTLGKSSARRLAQQTGGQ